MAKAMGTPEGFVVEGTTISRPPNDMVARALAVAFAGALVLAIYATIHQYHFSATDHPGTYFVWQNLGRAMSFAALAALVVLHRVQRGVYGWSPKRQLTDQQRRARPAVFAQSYRLALLIVVVFSMVTFWNESWIARVVSQPTKVYFAPFDLHWVLWDLLLLVASLPSLVGAWARNPAPERAEAGQRAGS